MFRDNETEYDPLSQRLLERVLLTLMFGCQIQMVMLYWEVFPIVGSHRHANSMKLMFQDGLKFKCFHMPHSVQACHALVPQTASFKSLGTQTQRAPVTRRNSNFNKYNFSTPERCSYGHGSLEQLLGLCNS